MLKTYQFKTRHKGDIHSSKMSELTQNIREGTKLLLRNCPTLLWPLWHEVWTLEISKDTLMLSLFSLRYDEISMHLKFFCALALVSGQCRSRLPPYNRGNWKLCSHCSVLCKYTGKKVRLTMYLSCLMVWHAQFTLFRSSSKSRPNNIRRGKTG